MACHGVADSRVARQLGLPDGGVLLRQSAVEWRGSQLLSLIRWLISTAISTSSTIPSRDCPWWVMSEALVTMGWGSHGGGRLMLSARDRVVLLQHDGLRTLTGKTGLAMLRHRPGPIVAVVDPPGRRSFQPSPGLNVECPSWAVLKSSPLDLRWR